jgi:transcription antitermination factor NusG
MSTNPFERPKEGSWVRVASGDYQNFEGQIVEVKDQAARVQFNIFGKVSEVTLPVAILKVHPPQN